MAASLTSTDLTLGNTSGASIPGTPLAGQTVIYPKDDKLLYYKNDAGVERRVDADLGYMHVRDEKAVYTAGGASLSGVNTRVLNTVVTNTIVGASLATNKVTLPAGTYNLYGSAPNWKGNGHKAYIYNVTAAALSIYGTTSHSWETDNTQTSSVIHGRITITVATEFELRHNIALARATDGLGFATNLTASSGPEVYGELEITKVA